MESPNILVLFYSMYGHTGIMAKAAAEAVRDAGANALLKQVPELMPEEQWDDAVLKAKEQLRDIPFASISDLDNIDGLILGTPTRYGNMCAQMRNFWDQTGQQWMQGTLIGKPAAVITSSATQHGGQETTIITTMITLLHHGMVLVGLPYSFQEQMTLAEITGGSPYGASTIAGQGERMPSENELTLVRNLGRHLSEIAAKLKS